MKIKKVFTKYDQLLDCIQVPYFMKDAPIECFEISHYDLKIIAVEDLYCGVKVVTYG
jgi:hypothetical protein